MTNKKTIPSICEIVFKFSAEDEEMHAAIGRFIGAFSMCEGNLLEVAIECGKLKHGIAKAILSPLRVDEGITCIRRIIEVRGLRSKRARELDAVLNQLAVINKLRNDLVHLGIWTGHKHGKEVSAITNKWAAHSPRVIRSRPISTAIILDAARDLDDIYLFLSWHITDAEWHRFDRPMRVLRKHYPLGTLPPWRYKSPEPRKSRPKHRVKAITPPAPPRS